VLYQPFGNIIFVIEEGDGAGPRPVEQRFVRTGEKRGDFVEIVSGIEDGEEVVTAGVFKLSNDRMVVVDNSQALGAELDPTPENS